MQTTVFLNRGDSVIFTGYRGAEFRGTVIGANAYVALIAPDYDHEPIEVKRSLVRLG